MAALTSTVPDDFLISGALVEPAWAKVAVVAAAYVVTLALSGVMIRFFILPRNRPERPARDRTGPRFDSSVVIGKCENIITVTFVLLGQETGLALIFAAKSLVRSDDIKKNPGFYLGGTLVNLVWALLVAAAARLLVNGI